MESKPINFEKLEQDFANRKSVVLFVGTGINLGGGIDFSWDALISHLLQYAIRLILPHGKKYNQIATAFQSRGIAKDIFTQQASQIFPRDVKTTIIKQTLGNTSYVKLIQHFLYGKCDKLLFENAGKEYVKHLTGATKEVPLFHTLFRLADMILRNRNIRAVVTQNYDQFLCDAIRFLQACREYKDYLLRNNLAVDGNPRDITPHSICDWKQTSNFGYDNINIYHVHGFIPRYEEVQAPMDNKIVLSMDEFYEDSRNVYTWQIASQLHFLSQYTCIFCGLSLEDYTNQRLLHYIKNKHQGNLYYITAKTCFSGDYIEQHQILDQVKNNFHEKNGLVVIYDKDGFNHIYKLLGELKYGNK